LLFMLSNKLFVT